MTPRPCILPPPPVDERDTDVDALVVWCADGDAGEIAVYSPWRPEDELGCDGCETTAEESSAAWCPDRDGMAVYWSAGPEVAT